MKNLDTPDSPIFETNGRGDLEPTSFGLTKLERACIELRIPESGDAELDELIRKARRQEFAAKAAQAMLANQSIIDVFGGYKEISDESLLHADALISALERTDG